jgi:putative DNA primase/helicase
MLQYLKQEQNKNLHTEIIEAELAGVFNWILAGLKRLLDQKRFSKCDCIR